MRTLFFIILFFLLSSTLIAPPQQSYQIRKTTDFQINGKGDNSAWNIATWVHLKSTQSSDLETKAKIIYSEKGIYILFNNQDKKITATKKENFSDLWNEDVVEIFLQPDPDLPLYFEYEISPLNNYLFLLIPNHQGKFQGWKPWRKKENEIPEINHKTSISSKNTWIAETFIPFDLFKPLVNTYPKSGEFWKGNLYRIDYDKNDAVYWFWQTLKGSFHQPEKFGMFYFE